MGGSGIGGVGGDIETGKQNGLSDSGISCKILKYTGRAPASEPRIFSNTTQFMEIDRGDVIQISDKAFYVLGNCVEGRFGIDEHPKFWVKNAIDLEDGSRKIVKLSFKEFFSSRIGSRNFEWIRSSEKESYLLELTRGDMRFMQGYTLIDTAGNRVRVIDRIKGESLYNHVMSLDMNHKEYFYDFFPGILKKFKASVEAIEFLHRNFVSHGDIRMDHLIIDRDLGNFRWIDFDFRHYSTDFDIWCLGNLLMFIVGKGEVTFHLVGKGVFGPPDKFKLDHNDASSILPQRIANMKKIFPYIPDSLNSILMRYSRESEIHYANYKDIYQLIEDLRALEL